MRIANKLSYKILVSTVGLMIAGVVLVIIMITKPNTSVNELISFTVLVVAVIALITQLVLKILVITPIKNLIKDVNKLGKGEFNKINQIKGNDEIAILANSFNQMALDIKNSQKNLLTEVKNKTKALESAKFSLENQSLAMLNVLEDVSEEKEYEVSRNQSLLATVNESVVVVNALGLVEYINPTFEKLFGFSEKLLKGKILADELQICNLKDEKLPPTALSSSAIITQDKSETKMQILNKNKEKIAVSISAAPIYQSEEFKGVVMVFHDFSDDLKLTRQKDDFFSIASHELRTPLTVISGNLDMIIGGIGGSKLTKADLSMLADTIKSADRLTRMVSDFLNVSRIDQGRINMHEDNIDICDLIENITSNYQSIAKDKGLKLIFTCSKKSIKVKGDEDKLREVIINLIGNSLKFTSKGEIKIATKIKEDMLEVIVSDTGLGIDKNRQGVLFQKFQQAMNRTLAREAGGTGLGLYISREFIRLMGGELILLSSKKGKGSTFMFTVPLL